MKIKQSIYLFTIISFSCSKKNYPSLLELKEIDSLNYEIINHDTGKLLVSLNPISYSKTNKKMSLTAVISYGGKEIYSNKFDTLIKGIDGIKLIVGEINWKKKLIIRSNKTYTVNCNGAFNIEFKRNKKKYLIFYGNGINTTGINTYFYFNNFEKTYFSPIIFKHSNCKID